MSEFLNIWQHLPERIDPVIFEIGAFKIQYYGLMYIVAFAVTYFLAVYRVRHEKRFAITVEQVKELTVNMLLGLVVGRLIRTAYGPFQLGTLARGAVEEVRRKTLREQLGRALMAELER